MHVQNAKGMQLPLLNPTDNNDIYEKRPCYPSPTRQYVDLSQLPRTPELLRSDSYDSNASYDGLTPLTPTVYDHTHPPRNCYDDYAISTHPFVKQSAYIATTHRGGSYEDDSTNGSQDKPGKRYPCRYRDSHGCTKTFTTSGHASRHSKIHTAEKAVQCSFPGCHKKFTRADNMKQHLETHYKDRSRGCSASKSKSTSVSSSTKRGSVSSKSSCSTQSSRASGDTPMWEVDHDEYYTDLSSMSSPLSPGSAWDLPGRPAPLSRRLGALLVPTRSSGLDALAAIACQEAP